MLYICLFGPSLTFPAIGNHDSRYDEMFLTRVYERWIAINQSIGSELVNISS